MLFGWNIRVNNYLILFKNVNGTKFDKTFFCKFFMQFFFRLLSGLAFVLLFFCLFKFKCYFFICLEVDKLQQSMKKT